MASKLLFFHRTMPFIFGKEIEMKPAIYIAFITAAMMVPPAIGQEKDAPIYRVTVVERTMKAINYADYKVQFTPEQKARLEKIFNTGVCDFTKPGVNQVPFKNTYKRY